MFATLWKVIGDVKNPAVTKVWRLIVCFLFLVAYGIIVSFATWTFKDIQDIRLYYITRVEFDKKCDGIRYDMRTSCESIAMSVDKMRASNERLRLLLLKKFMNINDSEELDR